MEPREYARMFALEERHWWYRALRRRIFRALRASGLAAGRCLDAGCGTGMNLAALGDAWQRCGIDNSGRALEWAARRNLPCLARASVEAIPLATGSLDLILSADVLYHRGVADDRGALREMARCLSPGGCLILNLPAFAWLVSRHDAAIHTARRYTRGEVARMLHAAGLEPVSVRYWNWMLFAPLAGVRLARCWLGPRNGSQRAPRSDLVEPPRWMNAILDALQAIEARLDAWPAPAGLSVLALARKAIAEEPQP